MNAVDGWIERGEIDPENFNIDDISGENTRHYVRKITKAYKKYSDKLNSQKGR